jgi:hypothetical protein
MSAILDESSDSEREQSISEVIGALAKLRYGSITVTVHDGRVVQIDVTEKRRLHVPSAR